MSEPALIEPPRLAAVAAIPGEPRLAPGTPAAIAAAAPARAQAAPRLELPAYDLDCALALQRDLGVGHVLAQVLVRRGHCDVEAVRELLDASADHDPLSFAGIGDALATIRSHIDAGHRITVHGDYDVDGVCATAIMVRALQSVGADVNWFLPSRVDDGYGLSAATVARLAQRGTRLLITVDCGITAVDEVNAARLAGLDVVVSDHHHPRADGLLPECPIVHPAVCGYPCPDLCGTGVAYKLAQALGAPSVAEDLELVALATVADLVPLRGENRRLVREGLAQLAGTARLGLRALMEVSGSDPSAVSAQTLGFRLAPRINAAGRLARPDAGLELLLTHDPERARAIAAELDAVNMDRRAVEQRIGFAADALVREMGERSAYVLAAEGWHPGVIGIVASRIVERYHRPAILIALDGAGPAQGSGRSIPAFDLLAALDRCSDHLLRYGGHRAAAGLSVERARIGDLREALEAHADLVLDADALEPVELVDAVVSGAQLGLGLTEELERLEPCGMGNPPVTLLVPGARFQEVRPMGEGRHARFCVTSGGARASAVAFGCDGRVAGAGGDPLDATFRLERNVWRGITEPRLVLRHARACAPAPIAVIGEPHDYLRAVFAELDAPLQVTATHGVGALRTVLDRRGEGSLAVLADACATGGSVLAVCADAPRRLAGLCDRAGGFALAAHAALVRAPEIAQCYEHLVVIDPPANACADEVMRAGDGYAHLAWGASELRFSEQMHELEFGLRASLVALYRSVRLRQRVAGEELERLLRGEGPHGRPARLAGRLVRVLAELELVSLDRSLPELAIAGAQQTELERSPAYREYAQQHEDGERFLHRARPRRRT
ncbi:MAG: single-stranded-DNA-specific exonuclease RecJ [Solirubrobacteraceae bacterium]